MSKLCQLSCVLGFVCHVFSDVGFLPEIVGRASVFYFPLPFCHGFQASSSESLTVRPALKLFLAFPTKQKVGTVCWNPMPSFLLSFFSSPAFDICFSSLSL